MKRINIIIGLLFVITYANGQLINCNPDPEGDPWWAGGDMVPTQAEWAAMTELTLSQASESTNLPSVVDNSTLSYFPDIFMQTGGSCAQAAGIGYIFTYEINRVRDVAANTTTNSYHHLYTYNFLHVNNAGSSTQNGWDIAIENGIPNCVDYDNPYDPDDDEVLTFWMSGYSKYLNAMNNRLAEYFYIGLDEDGSNFDLLRHWINDHNAGESTGGLGKISVSFSGTNYATVPVGLPYEGDLYVQEWGSSGPHAMTIVGYDENFKIDWNDDGYYTNNIDINGDFQVDIHDWEIGAVIIANSHGTNYGNEGFILMPYQLFGTSGGPGYNILVCEAEASHDAEVVLKSKVFYANRDYFGFGVAYGQKANSSQVGNGVNGSSFWLQGGNYTINGYNNDPLEFAFDFSYFYGQEDFGKVFAAIYNQHYSYNAEFDYFSMVDYRWNEEFELYYSSTSFDIGEGIYYLGIPYDLIPHEDEIESNLTLDSDMVCRFNPTVSNGATLTVDEGVQIDMYEIELEISAGSSLAVDDDVTFVARDGICKITVDGTITVGSNVTFAAEEGAQLQLRLNNTGLTLVIDGATFNGAAIISYINDLTVSGSTFTDGGIYGFNGDYEISGCAFDNSFVIISDASGNDNYVNVSDECSFTDLSVSYPLKIDDYPNFTVDDCRFTDNGNGIYILNSGDGREGGFITNCEITGTSQAAITVYNTEAVIEDNDIAGNGYGLKSYDNSNVYLGGSSTQSPQQTIEDNTYYEVYASSGSFPYYFHWNAIIDEDNPQPMVYYSGPGGVEFDVTYNYWGNNFSYSSDLYPSACYDWSPVWEPYGKSLSVAESLYGSALARVALEDYSGARDDLYEIVSDHSSSIYAQAALKKLFAIEQYDQNDYQALEDYLANEPAIQSEASLVKLADFLINCCEIRQENWQTAIDWFEDVIQNPDLLEDSVFAIIDLGYTYLWMQHGGYKSACRGSMTQYIPESKEQFGVYRDYLLSLLPGEQLSGQMQLALSELKDGELLQNVPNPFKGSTQIWYQLREESSVAIKVFDNTGKLIRTLNEGTRDKGLHHTVLSSNDMKPGIYFYNLEVNNTVRDSKKMTIVK